MALGVGLLVNLDRTSSWSKIIIYQVLAGIGKLYNFSVRLSLSY